MKILYQLEKLKFGIIVFYKKKEINYLFIKKNTKKTAVLITVFLQFCKN